MCCKQCRGGVDFNGGFVQVILYEELEFWWILGSAGVLGEIPQDTQGKLEIFLCQLPIIQKSMQLLRQPLSFRETNVILVCYFDQVQEQLVFTVSQCQGPAGVWPEYVSLKYLNWAQL